MPEVEQPVDGTLATPRDDALAERLRALPLTAPARSAWPALQARLEARAAAARRPRWVAYAAAAALALLAAIPFVNRAPAPVPQPQAPQVELAAAAAQTRPWIEQSQALEAALHASPVGYEPQGADAALASAELEDLIGMIDLQLSAADDPRVTTQLWQQRVELMQRLADIRGEGAWRLAINDTGGMVVPAAYRID